MSAITQGAFILLCWSCVTQLPAADPPPLQVLVGLDPGIQRRYSAALQLTPPGAFQRSLAQGVITDLLARGYWSNFCWPLSSDVAADTGGILEIQLRLRADGANWQMNVLFHSNQPSAPRTSVVEVDLYSEGEYGNTTTGPQAERLSLEISNWLVKHLLRSHKAESLHLLIRDAVPVGAGIAAPSIQDFPANFGIIQTDHPVLRVFEKRFRFEFTPQGAFALKRFKTKCTGVSCDFGSTRCIVIEFLDVPPPAAGQTGLVYLDQPGSAIATDLPLSP